MIGLSRSARRRCVSSMVLLLVPAFGTGSNTRASDQGWAQLHAINHGSGKATLNALYYDGKRLWIVGAGGLVLRSDDNGRTFQEIQRLTDAGLNDVFALDKRMWIVGDAGNIMFSTDGGISFIKNMFISHRNAQSVPIDLYSVQFTSDKDGFIVGDQGLILASGDGGISWREQPSNTTAQLFALAIRGKRGWVVGTGGLILHTDDKGKNWYPQRSGTTEDLNRIT
ncbi:MAG TPA: YCF48-related protein, partial [Blastocatellia bacterium]|nr:YCF48-related protein [Blastocatellia bacterium]